MIAYRLKCNTTLTNLQYCHNFTILNELRTHMPLRKDTTATRSISEKQSLLSAPSNATSNFEQQVGRASLSGTSTRNSANVAGSATTRTAGSREAQRLHRLSRSNPNQQWQLFPKEENLLAFNPIFAVKLQFDEIKCVYKVGKYHPHLDQGHTTDNLSACVRNELCCHVLLSKTIPWSNAEWF